MVQVSKQVLKSHIDGFKIDIVPEFIQFGQEEMVQFFLKKIKSSWKIK